MRQDGVGVLLRVPEPGLELGTWFLSGALYRPLSLLRRTMRRRSSPEGPPRRCPDPPHFCVSIGGGLGWSKHPPLPRMVTCELSHVWYWLSQRQHNMQHMHITRVEEKLGKGREWPSAPFAKSSKKNRYSEPPAAPPPHPHPPARNGRVVLHYPGARGAFVGGGGAGLGIPAIRGTPPKRGRKRKGQHTPPPCLGVTKAERKQSG